MPDPGATKPPELPVLVESLNVTLRTMERRLRLYRNLVICVSLAMFGSLIIALVFRKWMVLSGWLAIPLFVGCFFYLDSRTVRVWRERVLAMQKERGLDIAQLERSLTAMRYIPDATRRSMFALFSSEKPKA